MLTYPDIDPLLFEIGPLRAHWYGAMYLFGFGLAWLLARRRAAREGLWSAQQVDDLIFYGVLGVVLGGRVGYILFYTSGEWLADPLRLFRVWEGGMSFHGGLLGVLLALALFARRQQASFFQVTDFIAPLVPIGLGLGRLGNFINGELWGAPTRLPWGMQVDCTRFVGLCQDKLQLAASQAMTPPLHPSQLYEALLEGLVLFLLLNLFARRRPPLMAVSGAFLLGYGVFRFAVEFVRMPDVQLGYLALDWLTMGQVLSLPMIGAGAVLLVLAYSKPRATS